MQHSLCVWRSWPISGARRRGTLGGPRARHVARRRQSGSTTRYHQRVLRSRARACFTSLADWGRRAELCAWGHRVQLNSCSGRAAARFVRKTFVRYCSCTPVVALWPGGSHDAGQGAQNLSDVCTGTCAETCAGKCAPAGSAVFGGRLPWRRT